MLENCPPNQPEIPAERPETLCRREAIEYVFANENMASAHGKGMLDSEPPSSVKLPAPCVQNRGHYVESILIAESEPLPQNHPLTKWLYELFEEMYPEEDNIVIYLTPQKSVQGFCLGNGSIFLSRGLVELCGSKETLQFVLGHEYNHIRRGHFTYDESKSFSFFSQLGNRRLNEYEGDLGAVKDMEAAKVNPYGGVDFFRKMMEAVKLKSGIRIDLEHGSLEDRLLNVETALNIKDTKELSQDLSVYSEEIRGHLSAFPNPKCITLGQRDSLVKDLTTIPNFSFGQLAAYFDRLRRLNMESAPEFERQSLSDCYKACYDRLIQLLRKQGLCTEPKTAQFAAGLVAQLGTVFSFSSTPSVIPAQFDPASLVAEPEDLATLISVLKPELFEAVGAYCVADTLDFAKELVGQLLSRGHFTANGRFERKRCEAFVKDLTDSLRALQSERGIEGLQSDSAWQTELQEFVKKNRQNSRRKHTSPKQPVPLKEGLSLANIAPKYAANQNPSVLAHIDELANSAPTAADVRRWLKSRSIDEVTQDLSAINGIAQMLLVALNAKADERLDSQAHEENRKDLFYRYCTNLCDFLNVFNLKILEQLKKEGHFQNLKETFDFFERSGSRQVFDQNPRYSDHVLNPLVSNVLSTPKSAIFLPGTLDEMCEIYETYFRDDRPGRVDLPVHLTPTEIWWHLVTYPMLCGLDVSDRQSLDKILSRFTQVNPNYVDFFKIGKEFGVIEKFNDFLGKIFEVYRLDLKNNTEDARLLLSTSFLMDSSYLASMSQSVAMRALMARMDFEAGSRLFIKEMKRPPYAFEAIQSFIETEVCTHQQFAEVKGWAEEKLNEGMISERIGKMALADSYTDLFGSCASRRELYKAFSMSESDLAIKTLIAMVRTVYREKTATKDFDSDDPDGLKALPPLLYRSLLAADDTFKYFLIRKLLVGPKGLLMSKAERMAFLDQLLEDEVQKPQNGQDSRLLDFLKKLLKEVAGVAEFDQLYFMLAPLMMRRLLSVPKNRASWEEALLTATEKLTPEWAEYEMFEFVGSPERFTEYVWAGEGWKSDPVACLFKEALPQLEERGALKKYDAFMRERQLDSARELIVESGDLKEILATDPIPTIDSIFMKPKVDEGIELLDKFSYVMMNYTGLLYSVCPPIMERIKEDARILAQIEEGSKSDDVPYAAPVMELIEKGSPRIEKTKLNVFDFVLEVAQNLGSPGIRFLQLLGQYVDLPPQLEASISQVYDKVHGQNKLAAYYLVEREWPEFKDQVAEIRPSVGGGSLMTVYEAIMKNGERRILKVLNPNAEEKNREIYQLMYKAFEAMGPEYADALPLIEEIQGWISHDIRFENHLNIDGEFRKKNHGFTDGDGYSISVPQSFEPESRYFKMEEFVEGRNLTDLEGLRQDGHDPKKIVSLIARNYLHQLQGGLVHSDVHPGNFRITADRQVAILDRNFALEYSPEEIERIQSVVLSMGEVHTFVDRIMDLFVDGETEETKNNLHGRLSAAIQDVDDPLERTKRIILALKRNGVKLPLKFTLLFKNIFALNHLVKKVGYGGVMEAVIG